MKNIYLGIDFGAENIMLSYKTDDDEAITTLQFNNQPYFKNYYAKDRKSGKEYFGSEAYDFYFDSLDGGSGDNVVFISRYKQDLVKSKEELDAKYTDTTPQEVLIKMLGHIKKEIEDYFAKNDTAVEIKNSVITIPVIWKLDTTVIQLYKLAMEEVGFKNFRIEAEPVAAAANVITLTRDKYKLFDLKHPPQEGDTILLVDIGASTLDVNLCKYANPITAIIGNGNEYAGNYLDALLCSYKNDLNLEELQRYDNRYIEELDEIKALKETPRALNRYIKKNPQDEKKIVSASDRYVQTITKSIEEIIDKEFDEKIDYFVVCGGMSRYSFNNFLKDIADKLKRSMPQKLKNTIFFNENKSFNDDFLHKTIVNGAAMLAKNPELVTKNLPYYMGIIVNVGQGGSIKQRKRMPVVLLEKGLPIKKSSKKISLIDRLKKQKVISVSYALKTEAFTHPNQPIEIFTASHEKEIKSFESKDTKTQTIKFQLTQNYRNRKDIDTICVDALSYIDENGIIRIDIIDESNNKVMAEGKFDKFADMEENFELRI